MHFCMGDAYFYLFHRMRHCILTALPISYQLSSCLGSLFLSIVRMMLATWLRVGLFFTLLNCHRM
jgi:hypothetical protein